MRLVMMTEPLIVASRAVSGCLGSPWGVLGLPSCDSLHRPGYRALLPAALWAIRAEANPRGLEPAVEVAIDRHER